MAGPLIGALRVSLSLETAAFEKGADIAERRLAGLGKRMQTAAGKMANVGKVMTVGLTAPLTAFGIASFKAATDAAELQSSFDTTFGKMSVSMNKWAEETGNAMSRSTQEMQKAANTFGIFFNQAASPEKAAQLSRTFSVLAQDLASFFNTDTETAIEKLRAGLAGETEPLRAFGVFLNEAAVKSKALELGLVGVGGKLTDQQKIMARAAIIMEQTSKAQGDVARTSQGTANQIRAAKAAWEELQIVVGTKLLPVLTPLISKLAQVLDWFVKLPKPVQDVALTIAAVTAVTGPFLIGFGAIINAISKMAPLLTVLIRSWSLLQAGLVAVRLAALATLPALIPFLVPLAAIAAAVTAVYLAWKHWDKITALVQRVVTGVTQWLQKLATPFNWVKQKAKEVGDAFRNLYTRVVGNSYIPDMVDEIGVHMARLIPNMVQPAETAVAQTNAAFQGLASSGPAAILERIPTLAEQANEAMRNVAMDGIRSLADGIAGVITGTEKLGEMFRRVAQQIIHELIRIQIQKMLMQLLGPSFGLPGGGGIPGLATGGPVLPGRPYIVGERGPELFMPNSSGTIVPNDQIGGGGPVHIHMNGPMSDSQARRTGMQAAAGFQSEMARARAKGIS